MIKSLQKQIFDLEKELERKKAELSKLINDEKFKNKNQLIAVIEMHDQFYGIHSIELVENNIENIIEIQERYKKLMYYFEVKLFKPKNLQEDYEYLESMMKLNSVGEEAIQDWMEENEEIIL